jgi:PAS domain S-box-containing protein
MSKVNYRAIFENTGAASIVIRQDSLILLANKKFEKLSSYRREEIEGIKKWTEFVIEDDLAKVMECTWQKVSAANEIKDTCEFRFLHRLGSIKHILAEITEIPFTNMAVMSLLDITERKLAEEALRQRDLELSLKSHSLEEANTTLKVLLNHKEQEKALLEEQVLTNLKKLIMPSIENLKRLKLNNEQIFQVKLIETQLQDIISPFLHNLSMASRGLSPREAQVASLIKAGLNSKEIAKILNIEVGSVDFHRKRLRSKLGIAHGKVTLNAYLMAFSP